MIDRLNGIEQFITKCARAWSYVPGIAIGIVRGQRCVFTHFYGKRDVERELPVTEDTLFEIGSITKSFTATALGMLVDEEQLAWDTPICEYLPSFAMPDPAMTAQVTLRDLLTHRTGMPRHDYAHFGSTASRAALVARLRHLPSNMPFRTLFQYNNLQYAAAGWVLEQIAGSTWEEFIRQRIFAPLKMRASTFLTELPGDETHVARGYVREGEAVRPSIPAKQFMGSAGPAGSISSTVPEMCRWLSFQMYQGKDGKRELLKPTTLQTLHAPAIVSPPWADPEVINPTYGMGWMQMAYRGQLLILHGGATSGFNAHLSFLPQEKFGVVVLTNGISDLLPYVLAFNAYDRLLGLPRVNWFTRMRRFSRQNIAKQQELEQQQSKMPVLPTPKLAVFAGEYRHPGYGHLVVRATDEAIEVDFHTITYRLHQTDDAYEIVSPWNRRFPATLSRNEQDMPVIAIGFEPMTAAIAFVGR